MPIVALRRTEFSVREQQNRYGFFRSGFLLLLSHYFVLIHWGCFMSELSKALRDSRLGRLLIVAPIAALVGCLMVKAAMPSLDLVAVAVSLGMVVLTTLIFLGVDVHFRGAEKIDDVRADYRKLEKSAEYSRRLVAKLGKLLGEDNPDKLPTVLKQRLPVAAAVPEPVVVEKVVSDPKLQIRIGELEAELAASRRETLALTASESCLRSEVAKLKGERFDLEQRWIHDSQVAEEKRRRLEQSYAELVEKLRGEEALRLACVGVNEETLEQLRVAVEFRSELLAQLEHCRLTMASIRQAEERAAAEWLETLRANELEIASLRGDIADLGSANRGLAERNHELVSDISALQQMAVDPNALGFCAERCYVQIATFRAQLFLVVALYWAVLEDTADARDEDEGPLQKHELWKVFQHLMREMVPLSDIMRVLRRLPVSHRDVLRPRERQLTLRWYLAAEKEE